MSAPRKPVAFPVAPPLSVKEAPSPRRPRAAAPQEARVEIVETPDVFAEPDIVTAPPPPATIRRRKSWVGRIFFGATGLLLSLAIGLWVDGLVRELLARNDWLGWGAAALAGIAALSLVFIVARELLALRRLASVEIMRAKAVDALASRDSAAARRLVDELSGFLASQPHTANGRAALAALRDDVIDGPDLIRLAEIELLAPLDLRAQAMVLDAAKRVSLVTAVSPRAAVDLAYVVFEAARLIRRLSELYGARPATLGFFRLVRSVLSHLAVTGTMALSDSVVQQIVGQGLAARLSAKLGEGVVNGAMTARIGLAAMDAVRPLPFDAVRRPGLGDFLSALSRFSTASKDPETVTKD